MNHRHIYIYFVSFLKNPFHVIFCAVVKTSFSQSGENHFCSSADCLAILHWLGVYELICAFHCEAIWICCICRSMSNIFSNWILKSRMESLMAHQCISICVYEHIWRRILYLDVLYVNCCYMRIISFVFPRDHFQFDYFRFRSTICHTFVWCWWFGGRWMLDVAHTRKWKWIFIYIFILFLFTEAECHSFSF